MSTPPPRLRDMDPRFAQLMASLEEREPDPRLVAKVLAIPDEAPPAGASEPGSARGTLSYGRWLAAGAFALTLAGGAFLLGARTNPQPQAPAPVAEPAPAADTPAEPAVRDERGPVVSVEDLPAAPEPSARRQAAAPMPTSAKLPAGASEGSTFHEELALVEAARSALARGDAESCLRTLDRHDQRFPGGVLASEADITRIEALAKLGHTDEARSLADRFLTIHAASPYAERARSFRSKLDGTRKDPAR